MKINCKYCKGIHLVKNGQYFCPKVFGGIVQIKNKTKWTTRWPSKPGFYWFYGWPYGETDREPEWNLIKVIQISNGILTVRDGHFWYKSEGGIGKFCKVKFPDKPELGDCKIP